MKIEILLSRRAIFLLPISSELQCNLPLSKKFSLLITYNGPIFYILGLVYYWHVVCLIDYDD